MLTFLNTQWGHSLTLLGSTFRILFDMKDSTPPPKKKTFSIIPMLVQPIKTDFLCFVLHLTSKVKLRKSDQNIFSKKIIAKLLFNIYTCGRFLPLGTEDAKFQFKCHTHTHTCLSNKLETRGYLDQGLINNKI